MRIYYLETELGRVATKKGVTDIKKIPELLQSMNIGAAQVTNIKVNMDIDMFQEGYGKVDFTFVGENHTMNISSLKVLK